MEGMEIMQGVVLKDCQFVAQNLDLKALHGASILITGAAGFLGFNFLQNLSYFIQQGIPIKKIFALDNFMLTKPSWIEGLPGAHPEFDVRNFDVVSGKWDEILGKSQVDYCIHLASIASPTFYRKYPLETIDANVWGLRHLLEFFKNKALKGFLFFSSSEVYGDPPKEFIPTSEDYRGNVSCIGPRSCYDEAKRFSETLCYYFHQNYKMPLRIVRPFNNYGPGMRPEDKRVVADFALSILGNQDIVIHSDGSPTRTFCYVADCMKGYWKTLFHSSFDVFNIGMDQPEVSIKDLADMYCRVGHKLFGYSKKVILKKSKDSFYLEDNPQRRCPNISKARRLLNYQPQIDLEEGIGRYLTFLKETPRT